MHDQSSGGCREVGAAGSAAMQGNAAAGKEATGKPIFTLARICGDTFTMGQIASYPAKLALISPPAK